MFVISLFFLAPVIVHAQEVYEQSIRPTFGCSSANDALNLFQEGLKLGLAPQVARARIGAKDCFDISVDEIAIFNSGISQEDLNYFVQGIIPLSTASGRKFYSSKWIWQYAGDVTTLMN